MDRIGFIGDCLVSPYLLPDFLKDEKYLVFLKKVFPSLLRSVPFVIKTQIWFMHDGVPAHIIARCPIPPKYHISTAVDWKWGTPDLAFMLIRSQPTRFQFWVIYEIIDIRVACGQHKRSFNKNSYYSR